MDGFLRALDDFSDSIGLHLVKRTLYISSRPRKASFHVHAIPEQGAFLLTLPVISSFCAL